MLTIYKTKAVLMCSKRTNKQTKSHKIYFSLIVLQVITVLAPMVPSLLFSSTQTRNSSHYYYNIDAF